MVFDKAELIAKINKLEVYKEDEFVITAYNSKEIQRCKVSKIYEIFDIKNYLIEKIDEITSSFSIVRYDLRISGGIQELALYSNTIVIAGDEYTKTFHILNSTNKTRKLNVNIGLVRKKDNNKYISSVENLSVCKRHYVGITQIIEDLSSHISDNSFETQANSIKSLIGKKVMLSKVYDIMVEEGITKVAIDKFDDLKRNLVSSVDKLDNLSDNQRQLLYSSNRFRPITQDNDFMVDAYKVLMCHLRNFRYKDSYLIKVECDRILKINQCLVRVDVIDDILA